MAAMVTSVGSSVCGLWNQQLEDGKAATSVNDFCWHLKTHLFCLALSALIIFKIAFILILCFNCVCFVVHCFGYLEKQYNNPLFNYFGLS